MGIFKIITKPIGCLMSLISFLVFAAVIGVFLVFAFVQYMLPSVVETAIEKTTQFPAHISENDSSIWGTRIGFKKFSIGNPPSYTQTSDFILFNEVSLDVDPFASRDNALVFNKIVLDTERLNWVEDAEGRANITRFVQALKAQADSVSTAPSQPSPETPTEPQAKPRLLIHELTVSIGTVHIERFGRDTRSYPVNYSKTFKNVTNPEAVALQIASDLAGVGIGFFSDALIGALTDPRNVENVGNTLKNLKNTTQETGKTAIEEGKKAVEGVGSALKNLF